ncbi:hypothetical protein CEXT_500321 [Caerostris extrusa]|uniref:Uncharacterized protein n=1 Tax=Caerostris extrusa TaxID=172846 RepID=A0AAV4PMC6_CAEEX|nr:hypothetical protein CEXT_500321 [Caerostris extrusa]
MSCKDSTFQNRDVPVWRAGDQVRLATRIPDPCSTNGYITILEGAHLAGREYKYCSPVSEKHHYQYTRVAILFAALAAVHANVLLGGHGHLVNTGVSTSARTQDALANNARLHHQGWFWVPPTPDLK